MSMQTDRGKDQLLIVKWDIVVNLIVLSSFLYVRDFPVFAYIAFGLIFIFSIFAFKHHKPWVPIILATVTSLIFYWVKVYPFVTFDYFFRIGAYSVLIYTGFWILNASKNYIMYLRSLQPEICPFCGAEEDELLRRMGSILCQKCFNLGEFSIEGYNNNLLNYWDFEYIKDLALSLGEEIPFLGEESKMEQSALTGHQFGYISHERKITHLFLVSKGITSMELAIGSLNRLKILSISKNRLAFLPNTIQYMESLEVLDLRGNPLDLALSGLQHSLDVMKENGCIVHYD